MGILKNIFFGTEDLYLQQWDEFKAGNALGTNSTTYENYATIFTCARIISDALSTVPINIFTYKDGEMSKVYDDHRHLLLNRRPNGVMNSQAWRSTMIVKAIISGNSFSKINRDNNGKPFSIEITDDIDISDYTVKNGSLYYHTTSKDNPKIPASDIIHIKTISKDGVFGMSPAKALTTQLNITWAGFKTLDKHYRGGARPGMLLRNTIPITQKEAKNAEDKIKEFENRINGISNQNKITMVPTNTEPIPWNISIEDAKILDTIKFNKSDIAALYGIPVFMLGDYDQSKFNSIEYLTKFFNSFTTRPMAHVWRKELEDKLLTDKEWSEGMSIEFNLNALIEMDTATKTDAYQKYIQNGVIEPGFVAEMEGFPAPATKGKYFISNNHLEFEGRMLQKELENEKLRIELQKLQSNK